MTAQLAFTHIPPFLLGCPPFANRSPLKGGATVFPKAANFRVPEVVPQTPQGMSAQAGTFGGLGGGAAREAGQLAQSRRSLRQHGSGELTPGGADEVPWYCDYGAEALQVSPPPGTAVFFWDYVPGSPSWRPGELLSADATSLHAGCPVLAGEKLIATRWIRASEFF